MAPKSGGGSLLLSGPLENQCELPKRSAFACTRKSTPARKAGALVAQRRSPPSWAGYD